MLGIGTSYSHSLFKARLLHYHQYSILTLQILPHDSSLLNVNVAAAKLTFRGLSGQLVSGTIRLIEDSNSTWKIADLKKI